MDDQPKEGGEGDKKIVHVYPLVKVSPRLALRVQFSSAIFQLSGARQTSKDSRAKVERNATRKLMDCMHV